MNIQTQKGVGLVEVLVALLLLALGIFGFIALQYRASEATSEATSRVEASNIARDLAEKIRINSLNENTTDKISLYKDVLSTESNKCFESECNFNEKVNFDLTQTKKNAQHLGMIFRVLDCPAMDNRLCIYVAWDKTEPKNTTGSEAHSCTKSTANSFNYTNDSTCIVLEAYQ